MKEIESRTFLRLSLLFRRASILADWLVGLPGAVCVGVVSADEFWICQRGKKMRATRFVCQRRPPAIDQRSKSQTSCGLVQPSPVSSDARLTQA
jgi:hypothetical protein